MTDLDDRLALDAAGWKDVLAAYREPSDRRAAFELLVTGVPLVSLWAMMWAATGISTWLTLALAVPAAAFLVRLFMIQHDCGHGSFFRNRLANDWTGRVIGVITLTPYGFWKRAHALHHAGSGCLDHRGHGDITTLTISEYRASSAWQRLCYRLYRHPLVLFGLGPAYLFIVQQRIPLGLMRRGWQPWLSTMGTNAAIACAVSFFVWLMGAGPFLIVYLPVVLIAASIGVWLFFVQHQFEHTMWDREPAWDRRNAALHGSSHLDLPVPLRWLTASIGVHHVHHLASFIPFYRLQAVLRDHPQLRAVSRLSLRESLGCVRLALWDDAERRLVSFREARLRA